MAGLGDRQQRERLVLGAMIALVLGFTALRGWVAASGYFYWDDLIFISRAERYPLFSMETLAHDHDGHLMPAGFALTWLIEHIAPLNWTVFAVVLVGMQLFAATAVAWLAVVLGGVRPIAVFAFGFYCTSTLSLPSMTWWAAALNTAPLHAGIAISTACAVLAWRSGRRGFSWAAAASMALALLFTEKAIVIPGVVAATLALQFFLSKGPLATSGRRAIHVLGGSMAAVATVWGFAYYFLIDLGAQSALPADAATQAHTSVADNSAWSMVQAAITEAILPSVVGGPWKWERWHPGAPWATPPLVGSLLGAAVLLLAMWWTIRRRPRSCAVWAALALYASFDIALVTVVRRSEFTGVEIVATLRYFAELPVIAMIAIILITGPRRGALMSDANGRHKAPVSTAVSTGVLAAVLAVLIASSTFSTVAYRELWRDQPSRKYLSTVIAQSRDRAEQGPLLDQDVALDVLLPVTYPNNTFGSILAGVPGVPAFGSYTEHPLLVNGEGALVDAAVTRDRSLGMGPVPGCGYQVHSGETVVALSGPLVGWKWYVELPYLSNSAGNLRLWLDDESAAVLVPVRDGAGSLVVRVSGGGDRLHIQAENPAITVCVGDGPVGHLLPL